MARYLGKCRTCKTVLRAEATGRVQAVAGKQRTVFTFPNGEQAQDTKRTFVECWTCTAAGVSRGGLPVHVELRRVVGVKTDAPCSAKCLASTGFNCECACGGANHGSGH
jgi:hypothetical protein